MLSREDTDQFISKGYILIRNAIPNHVLSDCRNIIWDNIESSHEINRHDPKTWTHVKIPHGKVYSPSLGYPWDQVFSERLMKCIYELCGEESIEEFGAGWWTMTFPGERTNSDINCGSWHIDGHELLRYPYSKDIGLTLLMYFSEVKEGFGGTVAAEESHVFAIRQLIESGLKGCKTNILHQSLYPYLDLFNKRELTGRAGDVYIIHPYLLHARGVNAAPMNDINSIRFLCHPTIPLKKHLDFSKPKDSMSILELSIYEAAKDSETLLNSLLTITPENVEKFNLDYNTDDDIKVSTIIPTDMIESVGFVSFGNKRQRY